MGAEEKALSLGSMGKTLSQLQACELAVTRGSSWVQGQGSGVCGVQREPWKLSLSVNKWQGGQTVEPGNLHSQTERQGPRGKAESWDMDAREEASRKDCVARFA